MTTPASYARTTPPFHFQGTMMEAQKDALVAWANARLPFFAPISTFRRIQAHQLRKAAGVLEAFHAAQGLAPTFRKAPWEPSPNGHFLPTTKDDKAPSTAVGNVKDRFLEQLAQHDRAVFRMNFLRTQIEVFEDLAQEAAEAVPYIAMQFTNLQTCFNDPHYSGVLVKTNDTFPPAGDASQLAPMPRYRVHPLDPPTYWERSNAGQSIS